MANIPPNGPYPPPYYGHYPPPPGGCPPPPPHLSGNYHPHPPPPPQAYYVPGAVMMPYPMYPAPPQAEAPSAPQPTYVTNYIYHTPAENTPQVETVKVAEVPALGAEDLDWVPATNTTCRYLEGRAVVAGHEGWDGSPLWVVRAAHGGDLVPGKLSVRHNSAYVPYNGKEIAVQNIEVLCARPGVVRWVPSSNGRVPVGAIPAGHTSSGEPLYVGRARYQLSLTPGKVHPSHQTCYISFGGNEISHKMYDVLCRVV